MMMKAAVVIANETISYEDYPKPELKAGYVLVKVKMAGICGSDIPRVLQNGVHFYPVVLGHEFSGEVVEIGEGVTKVAVGDRVSGAPLLPCHSCEDCQKGDFSLCKNYTFIGSRIQGAFADFVLLPEINTVKFDKTVSFEQGAFFEPSTVALHGILQNNFKGGDDVAILGGGTIGIFTAQWARILGAKRVFVFDIDEDRLSLAKKLGADYTINTRKDGYLEEVKAFTDDKGFGVIFETAGVDVTMKLAFELAANKAKVCFIGTPHKDLVFPPKLFENMNRKEFTLTGSWMSYSAPFPGREWELTAFHFAKGDLRFDEGLILKKMPMSKAQEAFMMFKNPSSVKGKIMLVND